MGNYKDLKVWEKAHQLCLEVMRESGGFPRSEVFNLTAQLRRSALSVGSNIVEGSGRQSDRDMGRFLQIARGSLWELDYQLLVARDMGLLPPGRFDELEAKGNEVGRMLQGLLTHLKRRSRVTGSNGRTGKPVRKRRGPEP